KSTGFNIFGISDTVFFTDTPNKNPDGSLTGAGVISIVKEIPVLEEKNGQMTTQISVVAQSAGTVDYTKGEILINTLNIKSTAFR
ncbi:MAG: hypothetical protein ACO3UU_00970, partial [Minisyncoccia bacterium]